MPASRAIWCPAVLVFLLGACSAPVGGDLTVVRDAGRRPDTGSRDASTADAPRMDAPPRPDAPGTTDVAAAESATDDASPGTDSGPADTGVPRCGPGIDSDGDGIPNDEECRRMTDPFNPDTDMDGLSDGVELRYPRACVATDPARQRRPPAPCMEDANCMPGERCRGIDPTNRDSDGDGVRDGDEDPNGDGTIDRARGETDPRLTDTDGDGRSDAMGGLEICRPSGLATVVQAGIPGGQTQIGHDPAWMPARRVMGTGMRGAVVLDDPRLVVAGAAATLPATGDVRAEAARVEAMVSAAVGPGVSPVLVGRAFTTHDNNPGVTSTYRVARMVSGSTLRDAAVMALVGAMPPPGMPLPPTAEFLVDVTTVRRTMGRTAGETNVLIAISPRAVYETPTVLTAIRALDLVNGTAIAENDQGLGAACQVFRAERPSAADFLWTVDTSGSMSDDQERLGRTATQFFTRLRAAGVDFRVGVITAGSSGLNLDSPGFRWISGMAADGARQLCEQVTTTACPTSPGDTQRPYPVLGGSEEPTAAAVIATWDFFQRAMRGEMNPDRRFRMGARVVTFHVTDEPGSNDFSRYFQRSMDPMSGRPWGSTYNSATLNNIVDYFRRNRILTFGLVPVRPTPCAAADVYDLPRCVIEGNGGATIPITTATDAEVSAAMTRIVEAIAGASSPFVLDRTPITSTLKVRVRGMDVPRSRSEGFDYDGVSRAILFYGTRYRPNTGDEVVVSYRVWRPCVATTTMCRSDADCCAPTVCRMGRCTPPCTETGGVCRTDMDCCAPNACRMGRCTPAPMCIPRGMTCTPSELRNDCCPPLQCVRGRCDDCLPTDATCTHAAECCSGVCTGGRCACRPTGGRCTSPADCCSRFCADGFCAPG